MREWSIITINNYQYWSHSPIPIHSLLSTSKTITQLQFRQNHLAAYSRRTPKPRRTSGRRSAIGTTMPWGSKNAGKTGRKNRKKQWGSKRHVKNTWNPLGKRLNNVHQITILTIHWCITTIHNYSVLNSFSDFCDSLGLFGLTEPNFQAEMDEGTAGFPVSWVPMVLMENRVPPRLDEVS